VSLAFVWTSGASLIHTQADVIDLVTGYMSLGGVTDAPPVVTSDDPQKPMGGSYHTKPSPHIKLNTGAMQAALDQINTYGFNYGMDEPFVCGYFVYVVNHELEHANCCHDEDNGTVEHNCQEILADVAGALASCDMVEVIAAAFSGGSIPEDVQILLHVICSNIEEERQKYNTPIGRSSVKDCVDIASGAQEGSAPPCECTQSSWNPPKADPCSDCAGYADPGQGEPPFGGGDVIPECEACQHI
jgi:hypothetical protein